MGEYAKYNGQDIKIGTCETMYYLRLEDAGKVSAMPGNVDPSRDKGLFFRIPFPDEDAVEPGSYYEYNRGLRLFDKEGDYNPDWINDADPGSLQFRHELGLLFSVPCHHGARLPEIGTNKAFWNGKAHHLELAHIKRHTDGKLYPIIRCRGCGDMWRTDWEEVLPYVFDETLRARLEKYQGADNARTL